MPSPRHHLDETTPLLVVDFMTAGPPQGEFRTGTHHAWEGLPSIEDAAAAPQTRFLPLCKSDRNPYAGFVFVGRSVTSDVILRDSSVSKTHAVFERAGDLWCLRDHRSHNGTFVNGRRLEPGDRVMLANGDALRFGGHPAYFVMPRELRRILDAVEPTRA